MILLGRRLCLHFSSLRCNTPTKVQLRFVVCRRGFKCYDNSWLFWYFLLRNLHEFRQSSKAVLSFPRSKIGCLIKTNEDNLFLIVRCLQGKLLSFWLQSRELDPGGSLKPQNRLRGMQWFEYWFLRWAVRGFSSNFLEGWNVLVPNFPKKADFMNNGFCPKFVVIVDSSFPSRTTSRC